MLRKPHAHRSLRSYLLSAALCFGGDITSMYDSKEKHTHTHTHNALKWQRRLVNAHHMRSERLGSR